MHLATLVSSVFAATNFRRELNYNSPGNRHRKGGALSPLGLMTGTVVPRNKQSLPSGSFKFQSPFELKSSFKQRIRVFLSGFGEFFPVSECFRTEKFFRTADSGGSFRIRVVLSKFWEFFQNFKKCFRMDVDAFFDGWWVCFRIFWSAFEWMSMLFSTDVEGSFEFGVLSKWMMGVLSIPPNFYTSEESWERTGLRLV